MPISQIGLENGLGMLLGELKNAPAFNVDKCGRWILFFADWTDDQFVEACVLAARSLTFFPTVGELRAMLDATSKANRQVIEDDASHAWEMVRAAISRHGCQCSFAASDLNGDRAALWAVQTCGLAELGSVTSENRSIKAAEFRRNYYMARQHGYGLDYLAGEFEVRNRALGMIPEGVRGLNGRSDLPMGGAGDVPELPIRRCYEDPDLLPVSDLLKLIKREA